MREHERLEKLLGVQFKDPDLLARAFRHSSAVHADRREDAYEDFEFYGDKILGYILSRALRAHMSAKERSERRLTQAFGRLSSREALGELGEEMGLFEFLELGSSAKDSLNPERRHALVADVYEALVAAIHEDQGFEAAAAFLERTLLPKIPLVLAEPNLEDSKNRLWRVLQRGSSQVPKYKLLERRHPQVSKRYVCAVYHHDQLLGKGEGRTEKLAELEAATNALKALAAQV